MKAADKTASAKIHGHSDTGARDALGGDDGAGEVAGDDVIGLEVELPSKPAPIPLEATFGENRVADCSSDAAIRMNIHCDRQIRLVAPDNDDLTVSFPMPHHCRGDDGGGVL